ncbi:MAG: right-handed parallel beta-helix repeat-containing protein, partial [Thermoplasmata archaeon]|nr:right-handed parallel beta-helix repeat-containing protein [Thermoplasmata archaeon]
MSEKMKKRAVIGLALLLALGAFSGTLRFGTMNAQGSLVGGTVYDGSGGPWTAAGSPYIVIANLAVPLGETLTIEPGALVKFDGYYSMYIDGNLSAIGTETNRINITSNESTPAPGDWKKIQINSTGRAEIKFSDIGYGDYSILLDSSSDNIIMHNNFSNSDQSGIYLKSSLNNIITDNNLYSNGSGWGNGILIMTSSEYNVIANNTISYNDYGIYISSSSFNSIYHNNIIGNIDQAYESATSYNYWNDTYPSGGNYWSDYSPICIDNFEGEFTPQTSGNPDGICDAQYSFDFGAVDYYPLRKPLGVTHADI